MVIDKTLLRKAQLKMLGILIEVDRVCRENDIPYWLECGSLLGAVRHTGFIPWDDDIDIAMLRSDFDRFNKKAGGLLGKDLFIQNVSTDQYYFKRNLPCKVRLNETFFEEEDYSWLSDEHKKGHFGIFVDVFPVDSYSKNSILRSFQRLLSKVIYAKTIAVYSKHSSFFKALAAKLSKLIPWSAIEKCKSFQIANCKGGLLGFGIEMPFTMGYITRDKIFPLKEIKFEGHVFFVPNDYHKVLETRYGQNYMTPPPKDKRVWHAVRIKL